MTRRIRKEAAEYLTKHSGVLITEAALAARATKGTGPRFSLFNGRAVYSDEALDEWLTMELAEESPAAKRGRRAA
jgi:hypothetical protein